MKKILALMLIVWLAAGSVSAFAEKTVPVFDDILFENGKDALWLIASGDYELALSLLNFAEGVPSAEDFELFITANFPSIADGMVQYEVAVAYYDPQSALWTLAIPVEEPENEDVETFVLFSQDGTCFVGCGYMPWGDVEAQYENLYDVIWNVEYQPEDMLVLVDDANL